MFGGTKGRNIHDVIDCGLRVPEMPPHSCGESSQTSQDLVEQVLKRRKEIDPVIKLRLLIPQVEACIGA